jgi:tetratricopeptide (TPR) repeat protein
LTKEEDNLNPLSAEGEGDADVPAETAEEGGDLEVAWECFEQARVCFEKAGPDAGMEAARRDLAFVHQRLGDLLSMQSAAEAAAEEYRKALNYVPSEAHRSRAGILMVLGQALLMAQKYEQGKTTYVEAEKEFEAWQKQGGLKSEDLEIIQASMAEIENALKDCDLAIRSILAAQRAKTASASKLDEKLGTSETTTSSFDKASGDDTKKVITLVPRRKTNPGEGVESPEAKKARLA